MALTAIDWLLLGIALAAPIAVGIAYGRRAGRSLSEYFLSGRDLPWWLAGTSMVATTFAADTPLAVTGLVAASGVAGNWLWWNAALGSMLTVVFFARLWRRAGILTDVEFVELRYTGRAARALRAVRALYLGLAVNCLVIGWVNLALAKVLSVALGWERLTGVLVGLAATGGYAALAGLRGVVAADLVQFAIALAGAVGPGLLRARRARSRRVGRPARRASGIHLPIVAGGGSDGRHAGGRRRDAGAAVRVVRRLPRGPVVGELVSGAGAGRRRLRRPADDVGSQRAGRGSGDALVHGGALLPAPLAVGAGRTRRSGPLSGPLRSRSGLRPRPARPPAVGLARPSRRRVLRRLHVHRIHAAQLGHVVPGQRSVQAVRAAGRRPDASGARLAPDDHPGDGGERG